jgi:hypothetical protein
VPIEPFPEGVLDESLEYVEGKAEARMPQVEQIIDAINVFDIKVVVVVPAYWPSFIEPEPIAAVLEAVIPADHLGMPHVERVAPTEMGTVSGVRNAAIVAAAPVGSNGLWPLLVLRLLGALRLRFLCALLWLRFLCALLWLRFLCALLWLRFLCALWLRLLCALLWLRFLRALLRLRFLRALLWLRLLCALLWLRFLGALLRLRLLCALLWLRFLCLLRLRLLGALLWLRFLCLLRLRLVLRRLGFFSASGLFLFAFLCKCRNGGSEKQKQNCCADNSI